MNTLVKDEDQNDYHDYQIYNRKKNLNLNNVDYDEELYVNVMRIFVQSNSLIAHYVYYIIINLSYFF